MLVLSYDEHLPHPHPCQLRLPRILDAVVSGSRARFAGSIRGPGSYPHPRFFSSVIALWVAMWREIFWTDHEAKDLRPV